MKFIKKSIMKIVKWAASPEAGSDSLGHEPKAAMQANTIGSNRHGPDTQGMNFTVFNAIGGKVIQFNHYNITTDRNRQQLYIITDKEDIGQELGQIITIESLNR